MNARVAPPMAMIIMRSFGAQCFHQRWPSHVAAAKREGETSVLCMLAETSMHQHHALPALVMPEHGRPGERRDGEQDDQELQDQQQILAEFLQRGIRL